MTKIRSAILAMTIGLGVTLVRAPAAADEAARIVVIADHADAAIIPLLKAELVQLGLQVIEVEKSAGEVVPRELTEAASEHHAVAAFRVQVSSNTVEVWIADRATGKVSLREVFTQGSDSRVEARLVVLQAVELLRWSLKEFEAPHPPRGDLPKPPATLAGFTGTPRDDRLAFGIAPLLLLSPGGANVGAGAQLDMTIRWSWVGTRFVYGQLVLPAVLESDTGRAELSTRWFAVQAVALSSAWTDRFKPSIGLGVAMVSTSMHGIATFPRLASDDSLFTVAPMIDGRLGYTVGRHLQLTAGLSAMAALESDAIYFENRRVGSYGRLFFTTAIGVLAGIP